MTPEQIIAQYSDNHTNTRGLVSTKDIRDRFHSISQSSDVISPNPQYWSNNVEFGQKTKFDEADLDQSITWKRLSSYLENSGYVGHPPPHIAYQPEMYDQDATNENDHYMMHI